MRATMYISSRAHVHHLSRVVVVVVVVVMP